MAVTYRYIHTDLNGVKTPSDYQEIACIAFPEYRMIGTGRRTLRPPDKLWTVLDAMVCESLGLH